jgi:hypothetical protein
MIRVLPATIAGLGLLAALTGVAAGPIIPSSEMPGRERDRFTESPVEKFMQPGPYTAPPVITPYRPLDCGSSASRHSKQTAKRKGC